MFNTALAPPTLSEQSNIRLFRETWVTFVAVGGLKYDFWFVVKLRESILVHGLPFFFSKVIGTFTNVTRTMKSEV